MWKRSHHLIYSLLFVFSVAFISFFGLSSDSYAVSDITYTVDSTNSGTYHLLCNTSTPCSSYHFLKIDFTATSVSGQNIPHLKYQLFYDSTFGSKTVDIYFDNINSSYLINFNSYQFDYRAGTILNTDSSPNWSLTFTLSEFNPYSGNCPICPEIPENPYDDKLDSIRNAIILVPAVCLLLYFFYVIFGIIIPTTGGKK